MFAIDLRRADGHGAVEKDSWSIKDTMQCELIDYIENILTPANRINGHQDGSSCCKRLSNDASQLRKSVGLAFVIAIAIGRFKYQRIGIVDDCWVAHDGFVAVSEIAGKYQFLFPFSIVYPYLDNR